MLKIANKSFYKIQIIKYNKDNKDIQLIEFSNFS